MKKEVRVTWQRMSMSTLRGGHEWKSRFRVGVGSGALGFLCLNGLQGQDGSVTVLPDVTSVETPAAGWRMRVPGAFSAVPAPPPFLEF